VSQSTLRTAAVGATAGLLAGTIVAIPATAAAHALVLSNYQPSPFELAKATCCGQVLPGFWSQVLPDLTFGPHLFGALLGLGPGAAFGVLYVLFRGLVPIPAVLIAALLGLVLALPFGAFGLSSPWELAFTFSGPLGTVPAYDLPLDFRWLLALPVLTAVLATAGFAQFLDKWLPSPSKSVWLTPIYGLLMVFACIGLLLLPLMTGLISLGD
jgi:hypothetical protein